MRNFFSGCFLFIGTVYLCITFSIFLFNPFIGIILGLAVGIFLGRYAFTDTKK